MDPIIYRLPHPPDLIFSDFPASYLLIIIQKPQTPHTLPRFNPPTERLIPFRPLRFLIPAQHRLETDTDAFDIMHRAPSATQQIQTYYAVAIYMWV